MFSLWGFIIFDVSARILDCEPPIDLDDLKRKEIPLRRCQNCRRKRVSLWEQAGAKAELTTRAQACCPSVLRTRCLCETRASAIVSVGRTSISIVAFPFDAAVGVGDRRAQINPFTSLRFSHLCLKGYKNGCPDISLEKDKDPLIPSPLKNKNFLNCKMWFKYYFLLIICWSWIV